MTHQGRAAGETRAELADRLERETSGMTEGPWTVTNWPPDARDLGTLVDGADGTIVVDYSIGENHPNRHANARGIAFFGTNRDAILRALRVPAAPAATQIDVRLLGMAMDAAGDLVVVGGPSFAERVAVMYAALAPSASSSEPTPWTTVACRHGSSWQVPCGQCGRTWGPMYDGPRPTLYVKHPDGTFGEVGPADLRAFVSESPSAGSSGTRITHGRHCICTACKNEDWTNPILAHCGMHGPSCPPRYQPFGVAGHTAEQPSHPAAPSIGEAE